MEEQRYCPNCMAPVEADYTVCPSCGRKISLETDPQYLVPGTVLAGHFMTGRALGRGGFSITYIGRDLKLDRVIAIKEYFPAGVAARSGIHSGFVDVIDGPGNEEIFEQGKRMTFQEAKALARFTKKEGIVDVYDTFEENGTVYIIMEYLEGMSLAEYIRDRGPLTVEQTLDILVPVMRSLVDVHSSGIIHCDISPGNIMFSGDDVKLIDFGAAKVNSVELSQGGTVKAFKSGFAPPELFYGGRYGPWSDVYAMCATIYKCITGVTPQDSRERIHNDRVLRPSALGIRSGAEFDGVIMKGMNVNSAYRYRNMSDLLSAIDACRAHSRNAEMMRRRRMAVRQQRMAEEKMEEEKFGRAVTGLLAAAVAAAALILWLILGN